MGSWNETCGYSNLPIRYREKVRFMLIERNPKPITEARFYGYDLFSPVTPLFEGRYDDYGGFECDEDTEARFKQAAAEAGQECAEADRSDLRVNGVEYNAGLVAPWMMLEDTYQMILSMPLTEAWDENYKQIDITIAGIEEKRRRRFSEIVTGKNSMINLLGLRFATYELKRVFTGREMREPRAYTTALSKLNKLCEESKAGTKEHLLVPKLEKIVEPLHVLENLCLALDLARKQLHPMGGAGSQSWNFRTYDHLGKFLAGKAAEESGEYEALNSEDA